MRFVLHAGLALLLVSAPARAQQEPPRRLDLAPDTVARQAPADAARDTLGPRWASSRELRMRFVRDQTALGLGIYAPAFSAMVGRNGVTATAGYLVMAGGTFFAAAELTRRVRITEARHLLSTGMAWRTAGSALLIAGQSDLEFRQGAAVTLVGALGGTASGLAFGGGLTGGEAAATLFGHDLAWLTAFALTLAGDADPFDTSGVDRTSSAVLWTAAGLGGYAAGRWYAGRVPYNVTVGDVQALWIGATIGSMAAGTTIASSDPNEETVALAVLGGGWLGAIAADRFLVRRFDHGRGDGNLLALGGGAGALMGIGVGLLIAGEADRGESLTLGFATAGALAGVAMTERYLRPDRDAGRLAWLDRVTIHPGALAAAATRTPGRHALLRFTF